MLISVGEKEPTTKVLEVLAGHPPSRSKSTTRYEIKTGRNHQAMI